MKKLLPSFSCLLLTGCGEKLPDDSEIKQALDNPLSPPSDPVQRRLQSPSAKSNFLAVSVPLSVIKDAHVDHLFDYLC